MIRSVSTRAISNLHNRHNNDDDDNNCDQVRPPEPSAVTGNASLTGLLRDGLGRDLRGLVGVAHVGNM